MSLGDRFYFFGNRHKIVYELSNKNTFFERKQAGWIIKYATCIKANDIRQIPEWHKQKTLVIFLRNANDHL